jgi:predicted nuclease with TOPRIM domain
MSTLVDIENPEFKDAVKRMVTNIIQELLSQEPPDSQIALMLHSHIRDFSEFRYEVRTNFEKIDNQFKKVDEQFKQVNAQFNKIDNQFKKVDEQFKQVNVQFNKIDNQFKQVDERFNKVEDRLDSIESTMATKKDLERFATKEDLERFATKEDLNAQTLKIIDAVKKIWVTEGAGQ